MSVKLMKLPYATNALEPVMSKKTIEFHYGKHHKKYVATLNELIARTKYDSLDLKEIILQSCEFADEKKIYDNAAQVWNHNFFWNSLSPNSTGKPDGEVSRLIVKYFGSFKEFKDQFVEVGKRVFGSGWIWLVKKTDDSLAIESSRDAKNPLTRNSRPLLTCDVWEHAYYLDYQNERPKYLNQFWKLANWDFVASNLNDVELKPPYYKHDHYEAHLALKN
ncbi:MAG: Fe-Mn family superoxide dismutase [Oligoflexia bacterium]|nr:Fe-Mn family superoxide dismutase [Oligoflexia bacterium]